MSIESPVLYKPDTDGRRPLVIGASGSVGGHLVKRIVNTSEVYAGARRSEDLERLGRIPNVLPVRVDVTIRDELKSVFDQGISTVFNAAAEMTITDREAAERVNLKGAEILVEEASKGGIRQMTHISTRGIYGNQNRFPVTEDAPQNATDIYGGTKKKQEQIITQGASGFTTAVIRPADVIGEDVDIWTGFYLNLISGAEIKADDFRFEQVRKIARLTPINRLPIPMSFFGLVATKAVFIPVEVENLVDLTILASQSKEAEGQAFNAVDFHTTYADLLNAYAKGVFGKTTYKYPKFVTDSVSAAIAATLKLVGSGVSSNGLEKLTGYFTESNYELSGEKAKEVLGYSPRVTFEDHIKATKEYVRRNGLVRTKHLYPKSPATLVLETEGR